MNIISWNVNGIRAADKKGLFDWFKKESPDILCLQEIKAMPEQVPPYLRNPPKYYNFWNSAERKGYSGVVTYTKEKPKGVKKGFGIEKFDKESAVRFRRGNKYILTSGNDYNMAVLDLDHVKRYSNLTKNFVNKIADIIQGGN